MKAVSSKDTSVNVLVKVSKKRVDPIVVYYMVPISRLIHRACSGYGSRSIRSRFPSSILVHLFHMGV